MFSESGFTDSPLDNNQESLSNTTEQSSLSAQEQSSTINHAPNNTTTSIIESIKRTLTKNSGKELFSNPNTSILKKNETLSSPERLDTGVSPDYNGILHLTQEADTGHYRLECSNANKKLENAINTSLNEITEVKTTDDGKIGIFLRGTPFFYITPETGEIQQVNRLTSFEIRLLGRGEAMAVPFDRHEKPDFTPQTDLHTHFAGAITSDSLLQIGLKYDATYPRWLLEKNGLHFDVAADEHGKIHLSQLSTTELQTLKQALDLSPITQETFLDMESIYDLREPITKNKAHFPDLLHALAAEYQANGISYDEISYSPFINDPNYMYMFQKHLPQIEAATGVKIRFLAALRRNSSQEENGDKVDRIKSIARSRYVVGMDVMGHETNPTADFGDQLRAIAEYAMTEDPDFVIRVHAGENPNFTDNVHQVLDIIDKQHDSLQQQLGRNLPMPKVRIGHGLYGVDDSTIILAKKIGAIIEFNMSSNLALNNIDSINDVPIKKYLDAGVNVVLGTDGHGLYSTNGEQETILAMAAGLTKQDFAKLHTIEQKIISQAIQREQTHPDSSNVADLYHFTYHTPDGQPRWNERVAEKYARLHEMSVSDFQKRLEATGAITDEKQIMRDIKGKTPILITGASAKNSYDEISPEKIPHINLTLQTLINLINPEKAIIMTGGINYGISKLVHTAARRRLAHADTSLGDTSLICLGGLPLEAATEKPEHLSPNTITHAMLMTIDDRAVTDWEELSLSQSAFLKERNGELIAIGGGSTARDLIQESHRLGVNMHLMIGPKGASNDKAEVLKQHNYNFETAQQLIKKLYDTRRELLRADFKPENLGYELERASREIIESHDRKLILSLRQALNTRAA